MPFKKSVPRWSTGLILTLLFILMFVTGLGDFTDVIEKKHLTCDPSSVPLEKEIQTLR